MWFALLLPVLCTAAGKAAYVQTDTLAATEANQAAAVDDRFVYAIDNGKIGKYDREARSRIAVSTGEAKHLNSGFVWGGKVYCAHSNYPQTPEKSEIKVLDPESMVIGTFKEFGSYRGSLTWAVRRSDGHWWCTFAHYGEENGKTVLVELDKDWKELGAWTYPAAVVGDLGKMSISGGVWQGDTILATGHDHRKLYRLRLPQLGSVLELVDVLPSPFPGQGIAADPKTGGLVGIDRAKRQVVFASLRTEG
jgi:hypothetical protein